MPPGYRVAFSGEYESEKRAEARLRIIVPLTLLVIFIILYTMFRSFKWAMLILFNVALRALWRPAGSHAYRNLSKRILRRRHAGALRRLRADRSHHGRIH